MSITVSISVNQLHAPDVDADEMSNSRRSPSLSPSLLPDLWASTNLAFGSSTDLFVASNWLERSSSQFSVTLLVFSRADYSTLQVLTTFYVVFISILLKACFKSPPAHQTSLSDWSTVVTSHAAVTNDTLSIRSLLEIFWYAAKQACGCSAIRPNYQSQPQLMGFTIQGSTLEPAY